MSRPLLARFAFAGALAGLLGACATVPEDCLTAVGNPSLTPGRVSATGGHSGELQRWGGVLASSRNLADSTELTVVGYPLDGCGQPQSGAVPVGRFIVVQQGYLETAAYPPGTRVTATGILVGTREGRVGDAPYRYPILSAQRIRWWSVAPAAEAPRVLWPWIGIGIGGGSGGVGGGIGVSF
jgi:outer membrane lipoprotein